MSLARATPMSPLKPHETARYTREMLDSLRKIALQQDQRLLAHLLELAAVEARNHCDPDDHETLLPA